MESGDAPTAVAADSPHSDVIRYEVDKVSTLDKNGRLSPEVEVGGVPWKIYVYKVFGSIAKEYGLYVYLGSMKNQSTMWSIDVKADYILVNSDRSKNKLRSTEQYTFNHKNSIPDLALKLQRWEDLIDEQKGFIKDDKITVEVRFTISNMRGIMIAPRHEFTDSKEPYHDITFLIDGKKIHAIKGILALHSPVFKVMFYGEFSEKDKNEIELKDVDREEFVEMLRVIYSCCNKATDEKVDGLLRIGDRFQIKLALDLAEDHLISSNVPELAAKLLLSDQYRLIKLQDHCLNQFKTLGDMKRIEKSEEYKGLSETTKVALLEKMFRLIPEMSSPPRKKVKKEEEILRGPPDGVIRYVVENASDLDDDCQLSPEIEVKGVRWELLVRRDEDDEMDLFIVCLATTIDQSTPWAVDVYAESTVVNADSDANISEKGFVQDDKITVEIRFWISNMRGIKTIPHIDFTDENDPCHDITFLIDDKKIFVSKQILAIASPVFKSMLYGDFSEKNKKEIELKDVNREEFIEMLHVIYPCSKKITDESAEYLLKIGDQFQVQCVMERVEEFLIDSDKLSNMEKLQIGDQFRLLGLQQYCLSELKTVQDFNDVKASGIYGDLSESTKTALFEKLLEISNKSVK